MLMMMTVGEDGDIFINFFRDEHELLRSFGEEMGNTMPTSWLTADEAASEDVNYWPKGSAFLAEVTVKELKPKDVVTSWELTTKKVT